MRRIPLNYSTNQGSQISQDSYQKYKTPTPSPHQSLGNRETVKN